MHFGDGREDSKTREAAWLNIFASVCMESDHFIRTMNWWVDHITDAGVPWLLGILSTS